MSSQSQKLSPTEEATEDKKKELTAELETYEDAIKATRNLFHKFPREVLSTILLIEIKGLAQNEMDKIKQNIEKTIEP